MRLIALSTSLLVACGPEVASPGGNGGQGSGDDGSSGTVPVDTGVATTSTTAMPSDDTGPPDSGGGTSSTTEGGSTGDPVPLCGNGVLDLEEGCDDGNADDDDGCDSDCVPTELIVWSAVQAGTGGEHDCAARVVATADGVWVAGHMRNADTDADGWLARIDDAGQWAWQSIYTSSGAERDFATGLAVDDTSNAFVGGYYTHGSEHPWLRRVDPSGSEVWTQTWADDTVGSEQGIDLALVDGTPWLVVQRYDELLPLVVQWDGDGTVVATAELPVDPGFSAWLTDLRVHASDRWLFGAVSPSGLASAQPTLMRLGSDAMPTQIITVATPSGAGALDGAIAGAIASDGSLAVLSYDAPAGGDTPTIRRFDPEGTLVAAWLVDLDGTPRVHDLAILEGGDLVLVGERHDAAWARRVTGEGELVWERRHTPPDGDASAEAVAIAPDGDIVVAGCVGQGGDADAWVRRYHG